MAIDVQLMKNYKLLVTFNNRECRGVNATPHIKGSRFGKLKDQSVFRRVQVGGLSIKWPDGQDICLYRLYEDSIPCRAD